MELTLTLTAEQIAELAKAVAKEMGKVSDNPLTVAEFAKAVKRDPKHIRNLIAAGVILKSKLPGDTLIPASELERYRKS